MIYNNLYPKHLISHFHSSPYRGMLQEHTWLVESDQNNCGDSVILYVYIHDGILHRIGFEGAGCFLSQVSPSLFIEYAQGKRSEEIAKFSSDHMVQLLQFNPGILRMRCALLVIQRFATLLRKEHEFKHV